MSCGDDNRYKKLKEYKQRLVTYSRTLEFEKIYIDSKIKGGEDFYIKTNKLAKECGFQTNKELNDAAAKFHNEKEILDLNLEFVRITMSLDKKVEDLKIKLIEENRKRISDSLAVIERDSLEMTKPGKLK
jgi:hypothetical protein